MARRYDRRDFMGLSGAGVAGLLASPWAVAARSRPSTRIPISSSPTPRSTRSIRPCRARRLSRSRRAASSRSASNDEVKALVGKRTRTFDAKQMTVVPGFIDSHNHAPGTILLYEVLVGNPFEVEFVTIDSIVDKLRARARETPPGFWVEGFFFDDTKVKDKRALDVHDLDRVSTDHPVSVRHRGGHTTYYNSKAFALAGVTRNTPNSPGRHLRPRRQGRAQRPRHRPRPPGVRQGGHAPDLFRRRDAAAQPRRARLHLQAVRALRPDQRASRGRRSSRHCRRCARAAISGTA